MSEVGEKAADATQTLSIDITFPRIILLYCSSIDHVESFSRSELRVSSRINMACVGDYCLVVGAGAWQAGALGSTPRSAL